MAALAQLVQKADDFDGQALVRTKVRYNASGDTVIVPVGVETAACLVDSASTAPTATATATAGGDSVALTGGTTGIDVWVVTRHAGNPGGLGGN